MKAKLPKTLLRTLTHQDSWTSKWAAHWEYMTFKHEQSHLAQDTFLGALSAAIMDMGQGPCDSILKTLKRREHVH